MDKQPTLGLSFPPNLSDEAAYEIFEFLKELNLAFEEHYFGQIRRHRRAINPKRQDFSEYSWNVEGDRSFLANTISTFCRLS